MSYCAQLEVAAHGVVAFGDMSNDLPMLEWAGLGVAVANAHPLVRQAADVITLSNDEDGVAHMLERRMDGIIIGASGKWRRYTDAGGLKPAPTGGKGR